MRRLLSMMLEFVAEYNGFHMFSSRDEIAKTRSMVFGLAAWMDVKEGVVATYCKMTAEQAYKYSYNHRRMMRGEDLYSKVYKESFIDMLNKWKEVGSGVR